MGGIRVHADREATDIDKSIVTGLAGNLLGIHGPFTAAALIIVAADPERFPGLIGENPAGVALVEIEFPVRPGGEGMKRVIVISPVKAGEHDLAGVAIGGIEFQVAVDVREFDEIRRLGNDDHIVENRDAQWGNQLGILPESFRAVGFPITVRVFQNDDSVTTRLTTGFPSIIDALRHPDPALVVDVDVRRIEKRRGNRPRSDFQTFRKDEGIQRHGGRFLIGRPSVRR